MIQTFLNLKHTQIHSFYIEDSSPEPFLASLGAFFTWFEFLFLLIITLALHNVFKYVLFNKKSSNFSNNIEKIRENIPNGNSINGGQKPNNPNTSTFWEKFKNFLKKHGIPLSLTILLFFCLWVRSGSNSQAILPDETIFKAILKSAESLPDSVVDIPQFLDLKFFHDLIYGCPDIKMGAYKMVDIVLNKIDSSTEIISQKEILNHIIKKHYALIDSNMLNSGNNFYKDLFVLLKESELQYKELTGLTSQSLLIMIFNREHIVAEEVIDVLNEMASLLILDVITDLIEAVKK